MKIYDMHIHTTNETPEPAKLIEQLEKAGVYGGAVISACPEVGLDHHRAPYKERLRNVLQWTEPYPDRLYPILWIHPFEKDAELIVKDAAEHGISAFKMICDNYPVYSEESMRLLEAVAGTGKPVLFHSGILWLGSDTSQYNRPVNWECMLKLKGIRFALAHCSWPWYDECIAVYGKILNSYIHQFSSEMFFDLTPGTPPIYRKDLLTKLFCAGYDTAHNIMFGTDSVANDYHPEWTSAWLSRDNAIYDELGISGEYRSLIYEKNFLRFIGKDPSGVSHRLPQMNKESE